MKLVTWIRGGWLAWKMFWKYGPKIVGLGFRIYRKVEDLADQEVVAISEEERDVKVELKRQMFGDLLSASRRLWYGTMGKHATEKEVEEFREDIWRRMNPGKRPRRVSGKTRRRG